MNDQPLEPYARSSGCRKERLCHRAQLNKSFRQADYRKRGSQTLTAPSVFCMTKVFVPNSRERTVGVSPSIQLAGRTIWFRLNRYVETDVHNRPSGIKVTFRISKVLSAAEAQP